MTKPVPSQPNASATLRAMAMPPVRFTTGSRIAAAVSADEAAKITAAFAEDSAEMVVMWTADMPIVEGTANFATAEAILVGVIGADRFAGLLTLTAAASTPAGSTGATGPTGAAGSTAAAGTTGSTGAAGSTGATGATGASSASGGSTTAGATGAIGATGAAAGGTSAPPSDASSAPPKATATPASGQATSP